MDREEFFKWLETCPSHKWDIIIDDFENIRVLFQIENEPCEDDLITNDSIKEI